MKIKTSELTGTALDWAVAEAAGYSLNTLDLLYDVKSYDKFNPSTDWARGGPFIEQHKIETYYQPSLGQWAARHNDNLRYGPTPLIAAMRCRVASELGDEVEVPDEF